MTDPRMNLCHCDPDGLVIDGVCRSCGRGVSSTIGPRSKRWSTQQIRDFTRRAIRAVGDDGWSLLVPTLREAIVDQAALGILRQQVRPVTVEAMDELVGAMRREAGLE